MGRLLKCVATEISNDDIVKKYKVKNIIIRYKKDWNLYNEKNIVRVIKPISYYVFGYKRYKLDDDYIINILLKKQLNKIYDSGYIDCKLWTK